jgi:NTE family protein
VGEPRGPVGFVLGGGGMLGASEVGMLAALLDAGIQPDLVVGTSVGAINGAMVAADPAASTIERLTDLWRELGASDVFGGGPARQLATVARHGHLHPNDTLRDRLRAELPAQIEDLPVPFQCVAASIEHARAHWFAAGPLVEAVLASCAVPALLPPVRIGSEHFVDGGVVDSIPVRRAVELGARTVFVLHVGHIEKPLRPPRWPWEAGLVAFEIARRHGFSDAIAALPADVQAHILPTGENSGPAVAVRYRSTAGVRRRIERSRVATAAYLTGQGLAGSGSAGSGRDGSGRDGSGRDGSGREAGSGEAGSGAAAVAESDGEREPDAGRAAGGGAG